MGLFEPNYKACATTELEKDLRELENRDKAAQTLEESTLQFEKCAANINFAKQIGLINDMMARAYMRKLREIQATRYAEYMAKHEYRDDLVDSFENPRERVIRYNSMAQVNDIIRREKEQSAVSGSVPSTSGDGKEMSRESL